MHFYDPQNEIFFSGEISEESFGNKIGNIEGFFKMFSNKAKSPPKYYFSTSSVVHDSDVSYDFKSNTKSMIFVLNDKHYLIFHKQEFNQKEYENYEMTIQNDKNHSIKPKKLLEDEIVSELKSKIRQDLEATNLKVEEQTKNLKKILERAGEYQILHERTIILEENFRMTKLRNKN